MLHTSSSRRCIIWLSFLKFCSPLKEEIHISHHTIYNHLGFPRGSGGKGSTCQAGDLGSIPGMGRWEKRMATHSNILAWRIPWDQSVDGGMCLWSQCLFQFFFSPLSYALTDSCHATFSVILGLMRITVSCCCFCLPCLLLSHSQPFSLPGGHSFFFRESQQMLSALWKPLCPMLGLGFQCPLPTELAVHVLYPGKFCSGACLLGGGVQCLPVCEHPA